MPREEGLRRSRVAPSCWRTVVRSSWLAAVLKVALGSWRPWVALNFTGRSRSGNLECGQRVRLWRRAGSLTYKASKQRVTFKPGLPHDLPIGQDVLHVPVTSQGSFRVHLLGSRFSHGPSLLKFHPSPCFVVL